MSKNCSSLQVAVTVIIEPSTVSLGTICRWGRPAKSYAVRLVRCKFAGNIQVCMMCSSLTDSCQSRKLSPSFYSVWVGSRGQSRVLREEKSPPSCHHLCIGPLKGERLHPSQHHLLVGCVATTNRLVACV